MHFSIDRTVHTTAFDKPVVDHWLEWKISNKSRPYYVAECGIHVPVYGDGGEGVDGGTH